VTEVEDGEVYQILQSLYFADKVVVQGQRGQIDQRMQPFYLGD
jgi:hypothetical protein